LLQHYYLTFIFMLIPFFIINGILTGTGIEDPIVWYNNFENIGLRLGTIPIEDTIYAFTLILGNLAMTDYFHQKLRKSTDY
jgi:lycopene cyclase domain-containing protein